MPCGGHHGCWTTGEVNVGYYPMRVSEACAIRVGPGDEFAAKIELNAGDWFGVQSVRNPDCLDTPARRGARRGWVWGYSARRHHSGWVKEPLIEEEPSGRVWARGPAGEDFQVGADPCRRGAVSSCRGHDASKKRTVTAREVYLRFAPRSTPLSYLLHGDVVVERFVADSGFTCVRVLESNATPPGTIGWTITRAIR